MKQKTLLLTSAVILLTIVNMHAQSKKVLIAYFSRSGNNYVSGNIVNLPVGNTEVIAKYIAEATGGTLFKIEAKRQYPKDYTETTDVALKEKNANSRPELTAKVKDMGAYDIIILGYPIWWDTMPMAVCTFLEQYDLSGKTILPYSTHEGSELGTSVSDIKKLCPKSKVVSGLAIKGSTVKSAKPTVVRWLKEKNVVK